MQNHSTQLTSRKGPWPERAVYRHLPAELTPLIGRVLNRQLAPAEQTVYKRNLSELRAQLDATMFTAVWAEGERISLHQALTFPDVARHEQAPSLTPNPVAAGSAPATRQPPISRYPDGLTAREVEVLRLVAQGWTDAQIAEELVISTRTVNAHLTSIYRKIRVSSRHAAANYALTQHLL